MKRWRWWAASLVLLAGAGAFLLQSIWLQTYALARVTKMLAGATGGPVEIGAFHFDWRTLTTECRDVRAVLPGFGRLKIGRLQADLNWRSLFDGKIEAASVLVDRPEVNLELAPAGSATRVPNVLALRLAHFDVQRGILRVHDQERHFTLHGDNLSARLSHHSGLAEYAFTIASKHVAAETGCCGNAQGAIEARGLLWPDAIEFQLLRLREGTARLDASGRLSNFVEPRAAFRFHLEIDAPELAERAGFREVRAGNVSSDGTAAYTVGDGWSARGRLHAVNVSYVARHGALADIDAQSDLYLERGTLTFSNAVLQLLGGSFHGQASMSAGGGFQFAGRAGRIHLRELARVGGWPALPWPSFASGSVEGASHKGVRADFELSPAGAGGLSGRVKFVASQAAGIVFEHSELKLPHSQISFRGSERGVFNLNLHTDSSDELKTALAYAKSGPPPDLLPVLLANGDANFAGTVRFEHYQPALSGHLELHGFRAYGRDWDRLSWEGTATPAAIEARTFEISGSGAQASGAGRVGLNHWTIANDSPIQGRGKFSLDWQPGAGEGPASQIRGIAAGDLQFGGTVGTPEGKAHLELRDGRIYGERVRRLIADGGFSQHNIRVDRGSITGVEGDTLAFSGSYLADRSKIEATVNTRGFVLSHLSLLRGLDGTLTMNAGLSAEFVNGALRPLGATGKVALQRATFSGEDLGNAQAEIATRDQKLQVDFQGDLRGSRFSGAAAVGLEPGNPVTGEASFQRVGLKDLLPHEWSERIPAADGFARGAVRFAGKLADKASWQVRARADQFELNTKGVPFALHNTAPVAIEIARGTAKIESLELQGPDTRLKIAGEAAKQALNLNVDGMLSLQVLGLLDTNIETAAGESIVKASVRGTPEKPVLNGKMEIKNGSLTLRDVANGLTGVNGTVVFNQDRATIEHLRAEAGGGRLALGGFVTFGGTARLAYHLEAHAQTTRIRYANGISMTTDANLRLTGTSTNSLLSGTATISRVVFTPSTDVGNVLTNFAALPPAPANQKAFVSGLQLDVAIESAPNLQIATALSRDVEAVIDLRLRGTPERPVLLGTVSANQGDIRVFGGRYTINRGEVSFQNTAHIEPVLDLDLQTQARGINVDITISGAFSHLNISYRSDPPLEPRDIIALLTVGRTPQEAANVQTTQVASDTSALQANANSVLGQAIAPPSGRLSKLFGITNIKIDPLVQGITNTPQSRLTVEQQISRSITITYVTNLEQTSEQIFRLEWAVNRQYSIVAMRDDNGEFGIDIQYKKRFK
ncbi:MAG TPA: translocation/assembly module TamB domain-containing protein [Bryobacteraceae bacterium]